MADLSAITKIIQQRTMNQVNKAVDVAYKKVWPDMTKEARRIYDDVIDAFYADYSPSVYPRNESMKNGGLLDIDDEHHNIEFDPQKITPTHEGDHNFIYEAVFVGGFHGGPVWPWFDPPRPAEHTKSPLLSIQEAWDKSMNEVIQPKMQQYFSEYLNGKSI